MTAPASAQGPDSAAELPSNVDVEIRALARLRGVPVDAARELVFAASLDADRRARAAAARAAAATVPPRPLDPVEAYAARDAVRSFLRDDGERARFGEVLDELRAEIAAGDPLASAWSKDGEEMVFDWNLATTLVDQAYRFLAPTDTEELFAYKDGVYGRRGAQLVGGLLEASHKLRDRKASDRQVSEVVRALVRRHYIDRREFNRPGFLPLNNGVLNTTTYDVGAHDPERPFTFKLPVRFDPEAACPNFERFVGQLFPEERERQFVQEWFGANLTPGNRDQILVVLAGSGANGKSTLLGILRDLLGRDNVTSQTLQALSESPFARAALWGKLANIAADLPPDALRHTGWLKTLVGGDTLSAEQKYRDPFEFVNDAHLTFACNSTPDVPNDDSYALWRRVVIVPIDFTVTPEGADRDLPAKLRAELPGILNWALAGARSLAARGRFDPSGTVASYMADWRHRANSLRWFCEEGGLLLGDDRLETTKDDFQDAYERFCEEHKVLALDRIVVGRSLVGILRGVRSHRKNAPRGGKIPVWLGVGLPKTKGLKLDRIDKIDRSPTSKRARARGGKGLQTTCPTRLSCPARPRSALRTGGIAPHSPDSSPDPEDIFNGKPSRTDRARASGRWSDPPSDGDSSPPTEIDRARRGALEQILTDWAPADGFTVEAAIREAERNGFDGATARGAFGALAGSGAFKFDRETGRLTRKEAPP
ncbi:MAG: phage/plasmid primase, P4 family [Candidatus Thermoplasmatota archaeon]|nr:phage/plasmid primase, P4 family [Candidatus Thermoplasmatota archaeon]